MVASLIIFAFSAPAALVGLGFAMGQAGLVFGPVYCSVVTLASVGGANLLIDLLLVYPHCQNLPELGRAAMVSIISQAGKGQGQAVPWLRVP